MSELEEIKRRKIDELRRLSQDRMQEDYQQEAQMQQQLQQLESMVKGIFTKEALERYGNIKAAHPDKAVQLLVLIGQAMQNGQIRGQIDDETFRKVLIQLTPQKKEFKVRRI